MKAPGRALQTLVTRWLSGYASLTTQQLAAMFGFAVVVLMVLQILVFGLALLRERSRLAEVHQGIPETVKKGLVRALWNMDAATTEDILSGLLSVPEVSAVTLTLPSGRLHAAIRRRTDKTNQLLEEIGKALFAGIDEGVFVIDIDRTMSGRNGLSVLAYLRIQFDLPGITQRFLVGAAYYALGLLLLVVVISIGLAVIVQCVITEPLKRIAGSISLIDPAQPSRATIQIPSWHRHTEVGQVVKQTELLLTHLGAALDELRITARTDALTGLPNRYSLIDEIDRSIARAVASGVATGARPDRDGRSGFALIFLDIDDFKQINDALGHEAGDYLLRALAMRLTEAVTDDGLIARVGGDEFVCLTGPLQDRKTAKLIGERIIAAVTKRVEYQGQLLRVGGTVGIALFPEHGQSFPDLFRAADTAMYVAKANRRGSCQFFEPEMSEKALVRLHLQASLRDALEAEAFDLHYQPQIDVHTGEVSGCEALVRWTHGGRAISPGQFIPVAEMTRLIIPLGNLVLKIAGRQAQRWRALGFRGRIAVNVSPVQLEEMPEFLDSIEQVIEAGVVDPTLIELEITESGCIGEDHRRSGLLSKLRDRGFTIAMDDFGTGYSSLAQLERLPVDILKIDQAFTAKLPEDPRTASIILHLSRQLGLRTIAEGVETNAQKAWLLAHGCSTLQGFLFAPPLPAPEFEACFIRWRTERAAASDA